MNTSICVALDVDNTKEAENLVYLLKDHVKYFKIGLQLFSIGGPKIVEKILISGGNVFLDLKFHDIPNTVSSVAIQAAKMGVSIFNLHASGGFEMMATTRIKVNEYCIKHNIKCPKIIAVTVLTSIGKAILNHDLLVPGEVDKQVLHLANMTERAGLDGVVCSPLEVAAIRKQCKPDFFIITPGIRPIATDDDQKRISSPLEAIKNGSDLLVIGRPIIKDPDPIAATYRIINEIK